MYKVIRGRIGHCWCHIHLKTKGGMIPQAGVCFLGNGRAVYMFVPIMLSYQIALRSRAKRAGITTRLYTIVQALDSGS